MGTGWRLRNNVVFGRLEAFGERVAWIARLNRNEVFAAHHETDRLDNWTTSTTVTDVKTMIQCPCGPWIRYQNCFAYLCIIFLDHFGPFHFHCHVFITVEFRWRIFWILSRRFCSSTSLSGLTLEAEHALQVQVARCCRVPKTSHISHIPPQDTFGAMSYNELKMIHDRHQRKSAFIVSREGPKFRKSSKS